MNRKRNSRIVRSSILIVLCIVFFVGFVIAFLPYVERYQNKHETQKVIAEFQRQKISYTTTENAPINTQTKKTPPYLSELRQMMEDYNRNIYESGQAELIDAWAYREEPFNLTQYGMESDVVGLLSIPCIDVKMPIYLGASYTNLLKGCAVLTQTSMPIGGENTNCVIAAHRGWNEIPFVRDIESVQLNDSIFVENLWETLEYRVTKIQIIYPHEYENILIQPEKDMLTIVTCHPYRVNSHRYLVFAERYEEDETPLVQNEDQPQEAKQIVVSPGIEYESSATEIFFSSELPAIILLVILALVVIVAVSNVLCYIRKKKRKTL